MVQDSLTLKNRPEGVHGLLEDKRTSGFLTTEVLYKEGSPG